MRDSRHPNPRHEFENNESAVRSYCRDMPAVFTRAKNALLWDEDGTQYIDFLSACGSLNYGHNHPLMKAAVAEYLGQDGLLNGLDLHTAAKRDFLRLFREIILAPRGLDYRIQFTGPTGTNAVEASLKLARKITRRRPVVSFTNAFHGMTLGSLAVGARSEHRNAAGLDLGGVVRLPFDGYRGAGSAELQRYEETVKDPSGGLEPPAAFIVETIQGEGGLNAATTPWLSELFAVAKRLGALIIVDDVQAGCGRTGDFFSFEATGLKPDIVCLAKSIGGIGLPMALVLIKPEFDKWSPGEHNGTFRGNNLAFVAAAVAAGLWRDLEFRSQVARSSERIQEWLAHTSTRIGVSVAYPKGRGMMSGLAFTDVALAEQIKLEAFQRKLIIETSGPHGEVLKIMPPLTIEQNVLEEGLERLRAAIECVLSNEALRSAA